LAPVPSQHSAATPPPSRSTNWTRTLPLPSTNRTRTQPAVQRVAVRSVIPWQPSGSPPRGIRRRWSRRRGTLSAPRPLWAPRPPPRDPAGGAPRRAECQPSHCSLYKPSPPPLPYKVDTSRPSLRTNWTRLVHPSVLIGHVSATAPRARACVSLARYTRPEAPLPSSAPTSNALLPLQRLVNGRCKRRVNGQCNTSLRQGWGGGFSHVERRLTQRRGRVDRRVARERDLRARGNEIRTERERYV